MHMPRQEIFDLFERMFLVAEEELLRFTRSDTRLFGFYTQYFTEFFGIFALYFDCVF